MAKSSSAAARDVQKRVLFWVAAILASGIGLAVLAVVTLSVIGLSFFAVAGNSMHPTLSHGENIVLKKEQQVRKDQIFLFTKPDTWEYMGTENPLLIKRVHAVEGDTVSYTDGSIFVNDELVLDTAAADYECENATEDYEHRLTNQEVFVVGDNIGESLDSIRVFCDGNAEHMYVAPQHTVDYGRILTTF